MRGPAKYFRGNPKLKAAYTKINFTSSQIDELKKCADDPIYFIKNYVKIINVDLGLIPFDLYPYQEELITSCKDNRFVVAKLSRQLGKTTTVAAFFLWSVIFTENYSVAILANKLSTSREILYRIQTMYENLPFWMQQGIVEWTKSSVFLENGSRVIAAATSSDAVRGFSFNAVLLDEFAMVPNSIAEDFFASVFPTISSGTQTKLFVLTTPKGMNHFYKLWTEAQEGKNGFVWHEKDWRAVPTRDEEWEQSQKRTLGRLFSQEHEAQFIGSSNTLLSAVALNAYTVKDPIYETPSGELCVWEEPIRKNVDDPKSIDHCYLITVDSSEGKLQDSSVFSVIDITEYPHRVVARYKSDEVSPVLFPQFIYDVGKKYNDAFILIEANSTGGQVADTLHLDLEYENLLRTVSQARSGQTISQGHKKNARLGVKMSAPVKAVGCTSLKSAIETQKLICWDFDTYSEFTTFVSNGKSYAAEQGEHDDLVMSLVLYGWATSQQFFKDLTNVTLRQKLVEANQEYVDQSALPYPMFNDGQTETAVIGTDGLLYNKVDSYQTENEAFWRYGMNSEEHTGRFKR